jgi:aminopeptidase N
VWLTASGVLGSVENLLERGPETDAFHAFGRGLLGEVWSGCGWSRRSTDTHSDVLLRSLVIGRLGHFRDGEVVDEAKRRFDAEGGALEPDLRGAVYGIVSEHGDGRVWERLRGMYEKSELQEEKVRLLRAFTRFRDPKIIREALRFSLSGRVRPQDAYVILAGFGSNGSARAIAWAFVKSRWNKIRSMYKSGSVGLLGHILEGSAGGFSEEAERKDVRAFFDKHPVPGTERTRLQTLELIRANVSWKKRDKEEIVRWLRRV